jgi:hypothetical protein
LRRYAEKPERLVVGLMSGTSVDGVDAALVRLSGTGRSTTETLVHFITHPFPADLRRTVLALSHGEGNAEAVSRLNFALGILFADAAETVLNAAGVETDVVDAVASHGQTISHTAPAATLQIGEPAVIAGRLGVPVVSDFRVADVALGGQGAPLVPYADWCLLTHPTRTRAVQNIGGIGNVTFLPADAAPGDVLGFDTGPGNMLIDRAVQWATDGQFPLTRTPGSPDKAAFATACVAERPPVSDANAAQVGGARRVRRKLLAAGRRARGRGERVRAAGRSGDNDRLHGRQHRRGVPAFFAAPARRGDPGRGRCAQTRCCAKCCKRGSPRPVFSRTRTLA